ncbi:MAG: outer membrane beta-barrel protein [Halanaerobium sp.]
MKKIMVVLVVMAMFLFSFNVFAQAQSSWSFKAGLDFGSTIEIGNAEHNSEMGYSLIGEYKMAYMENWNLGAGLAYQLNRKDENADVDFGFTPFYGLAEYRMQDSPFYFVGHLGFASFSFDHPDADDSSGGLYYALGGGMDLGQRYEAEVLYTNNSGESDNDDVDYSKFTVTFGMRF